ncbi:MAG: dihydroneopterin aldolase [Alphaproteobacteria bacterium]|nr:dihydroneopterin aldolase [Alphaproteobacteria bacterium]MCW5738800.1 dihydroneopterin aldolase [Alphaproteobacteria bacterium]
MSAEDHASNLLRRDGETRRIFLRDLKVMADIGIHDFEKAARQKLLINIDLWVEVHKGDLGDDIANVLDYDFVRKGVVALVASRRFNLQETLVHAILDLCLTRPQVLVARVSSAKTDVYPDVAAAGYEATRVRR